MSLNKNYFYFFLLLFLIEALIAIFFKEGFIRHTFGDFLVVMLMYCFLKSFWNTKPVKAALVVLVIAFLVEFFQYLNLLKALHLENQTLAKTVFGSTFQFSDLIAYSLGVITILLIEFKHIK